MQENLQIQYSYSINSLSPFMIILHSGGLTGIGYSVNDVLGLSYVIDHYHYYQL
jgi:hypothetical protein